MKGGYLIARTDIIAIASDKDGGSSGKFVEEKTHKTRQEISFATAAIPCSDQLFA